MDAHALRSEPSDGFASLRAPASRREIQAAFALIAGYVAVVLVLAPWATLQGPSIPQSVAVFTTGIIVAEFATACLLRALIGDEPDWLILMVSCAYLYSALMGIAHLLTFPGAIVPGTPLVGGAQLTSYVFNGWRIGFAMLIFGAVLAPEGRREMPMLAWRSVVRYSWYAIVAIVVIGFATGLAAENALPVAVSSGQFTIVGLVLSWIAAALGALALVSLLIKTRGKQVLYLWLILALTTFCGDLFLSTISGGRFTLGWYVARASGFVSGGTLFVLFLMRFAGQQKMLFEAAGALKERTLNLQLEVSRRREAEDQLVQSQKVEALGQLTGGIAHDFNNLLAVVVGNLDLLRASPAGKGPLVSYIDSALSAAERGTKLASQLLVFSRAQRLELKPLVASDVIAGMEPLLTSTLGPQINVRIELNPTRAAVLSERTQLELAILNLAINARDAMPAGGELTISVRSVRVESDLELTPGDYVRVSVADTGSGMEPAVAARAFEPFFTTKGPGKGTGLGLSQVFGIARRAGGTARVDSKVGVGTTIYLFLRCTDIDPQTVVHGAGRSGPEEPTALKILVVDDDHDVRQLLVNMISSLGHASMVADRGATGLVAIEQSKPDLVLVDFAMPGMNGAEFAEKLRERFPRMPIVFVTGYADTGMIESAADRDALILRKPFRSFELKAILGEAMSRRR
jgi:signal transduction histidine kinase/CheY-like chemotaxis protein